MFPVFTRRSHLVSILLGKSVVTIYEMGPGGLGLTVIQESKRYRPIEQDRTRVPRAESQG